MRGVESSHQIFPSDLTTLNQKIFLGLKRKLIFVTAFSAETNTT